MMAERYLDGASIATPLSSISKTVRIKGGIPATLAGGVRCLDIGGLRLSHGSF